MMAAAAPWGAAENKAQRGVRREHEVMTTMDKARCLEGGERVDHF